MLLYYLALTQKAITIILRVMGFLKNAEIKGWSIVVPNPTDSALPIPTTVLQDARTFLGGIDPAVEQSFAFAAAQHALDTSGHFLGAVASWFDNKGITIEGFPVEDPIGTTARIRELKDLHVNGSLQEPYFFQLSCYITKRGKRGYAFVAHHVEEGSGVGLQFGEPVTAFRVEEKTPGEWVEYGIDPDPRYKLGFLAEIASQIYDYFVLIIPSEPNYDPGGDKQPVPMAA